MTSRSALKSAKEIKIKLIRAHVRALRTYRCDISRALHVSVKGLTRRLFSSEIRKRLGLLINCVVPRVRIAFFVSLSLSDLLTEKKRVDFVASIVSFSRVLCVILGLASVYNRCSNLLAF